MPSIFVKSRELEIYKGGSTCCLQVIPSGEPRNTWSVVRNNANNAWNVNIGNGNVNNNNVNNRYVAAGASELQILYDEILRAESDCYKNKHDSLSAAQVHYHMSDVLKLVFDLRNGTWSEGTAIVFAISYPTYREVWAAAYTDRILHHLVAPIMSAACEHRHMLNGDVSHGNRVNHSAQTAALQIQSYMKRFPDWWVGKRDFSGFFMSINRRMAADVMIEQINDSGLPDKYNGLIRELIEHDPCENCEIHSSDEEMSKIPRNKSQLHAPKGFALPIGNFYSQLAANLYVWKIDEIAISDKWSGRIYYTRFVDDICVVGENKDAISEFFDDVELVARKTLQLTMHHDKRYMQPVRNGVSFCGRTIHNHGVYINNRTVRACKNRVRMYGTDKESEIKLIRSLNSYYGFFKHCKSFSIQKRIADRVVEKHGGRITTELRGKKNKTQIVFHLADELTDKYISKNQLIDYLKLNKYESRKIRKRCLNNKNCRRRQRRKVHF